MRDEKKQPARWMIYGANGFTGKLVAEEAARRGLKPVLAGRDAEKISAIANSLQLEHRCFNLGSEEEIGTQIKDIDTVLHCAGPFSATAKPMIDACIKTSTNYLDITGEIATFALAQSLDNQAKAAGCVLIPGVGFDIVATDCLAAKLAERINQPDTLELAFCGEGGISPGTAKTMIEMLPEGGKIRRNGVIETVPSAFIRKNIAFSGKQAWCMSIPWGDIHTAYFTTGIPNITVYTATPRLTTYLMRLCSPLMTVFHSQKLQNHVKKLIEQKLQGPNQSTMDSGYTLLWGKVSNRQGDSAECLLNVAEGYKFTVASSLACVEKVVEKKNLAPGYHTPGSAFGADFILDIETSRYIER
ncbi:MAG: saccharopine dehydrogenase NADP-binding domain-containing protein [Pseudomonadales bacterium]|nr:saccharopine dehydrogenase NADP-binding domain-containing protein [Pseudomonadales bacterium]